MEYIAQVIFRESKYIDSKEQAQGTCGETVPTNSKLLII